MLNLDSTFGISLIFETMLYQLPNFSILDTESGTKATAQAADNDKKDECSRLKLQVKEDCEISTFLIHM